MNTMKIMGVYLTLLCTFGCADAMDDDRYDDVRTTEQEILGGSFSSGIPGIASLQFQTSTGWKHFCTGTLIRGKYVLTAAHCVDDISDASFTSRSLRVCVGRKDRRCAEGAVNEAHLSARFAHPNFSTGENDIALVKLDRRISLPKTTLSGGVPIEGHAATVFGWGRVSETHSILPNRLIKLTQKIMFVEPTTILTRRELVSGEIKGVLSGDSGGPLMRAGKQIGVTRSRLFGSGIVDVDIYTRVGPYRLWITKCIQNNNNCSSP